MGGTDGGGAQRGAVFQAALRQSGQKEGNSITNCPGERACGMLLAYAEASGLSVVYSCGAPDFSHISCPYHWRKEMKEKAVAVREEMDKELRNPLRMCVYLFLTTVLTVAAIEGAARSRRGSVHPLPTVLQPLNCYSPLAHGIADSLTEKPAWGRVALYGVLAAFLAYTAYQEMKYLNEKH